MKNQIAIYLRLSLEDVDKRTNAVKDDSNSIASQRLLINRHLDQTPMLCDLPRIEFCDDGFSGTNFDRPDFQRMIECAKRGEISCIVVKDDCGIITQRGLCRINTGVLLILSKN